MKKQLKPFKVIGISGQKDSGVKTVSSIFEKNGFQKICFNDEVNRISSKLMNRDDLSEEDLDKIRELGYNVNKRYWINLILSSLKDSHVVIEGIQENDMVPAIKTYHVTKDMDEKPPSGAKAIRNVFSNEEFEDIVERIAISEK